MEELLSTETITSYWLNHKVRVEQPPGRFIEGECTNVDVRQWSSNGRTYQYIQLTIRGRKYDAKRATRVA